MEMLLWCRQQDEKDVCLDIQNKKYKKMNQEDFQKFSAEQQQFFYKKTISLVPRCFGDCVRNFTTAQL